MKKGCSDNFKLLVDILYPEEERESSYYNHVNIVVSEFYDKTYKDDLHLKYSQMYNTPDLSFEKLKKIQELFDCKDIRQNSFNIPGCDTCDYGSDHGFEIRIVKPRKNKDMYGEFRDNSFLTD